jgi:hypothetical protein
MIGKKSFRREVWEMWEIFWNFERNRENIILNILKGRILSEIHFNFSKFPNFSLHKNLFKILSKNLSKISNSSMISLHINRINHINIFLHLLLLWGYKAIVYRYRDHMFDSIYGNGRSEKNSLLEPTLNSHNPLNTFTILQ